MWPVYIPMSRYFTSARESTITLYFLAAILLTWHFSWWLSERKKKCLNHFHKCDCYLPLTWSHMKFNVSVQLQDKTLSTGKIHCWLWLITPGDHDLLETVCHGSVMPSSSQQPCTIHWLARVFYIASSKVINKNIKQQSTNHRTLYYIGNVLSWC